MTINKALAMQLIDLQHKLQEAEWVVARLFDGPAPLFQSTNIPPRMCSEVDEMEPDLTRCPSCGGPADNGHDRCLPPAPYRCSKCEGEPDLVECLWCGGSTALNTAVGACCWEGWKREIDTLKAALTTAEAQRDALAHELTNKFPRKEHHANRIHRRHR